MTQAAIELSTDILDGAAAIAEFIFGDPKERRRVYHLAAKGLLPCFHIGAGLYARKSTLLAWIERHERLSGADAANA